MKLKGANNPVTKTKRNQSPPRRRSSNGGEREEACTHQPNDWSFYSVGVNWDKK